MKRGTPGHPKMQDLADKLGVRVYAATGILEMLWHYAGTYAPRGDIGRVSDRVLARAVDWDREPSELINALVECRWLDKNEEHRLVIHDWAEHAEATVAKKLQRNKESFLAECGVRSTIDESTARQERPSRVAKAMAEATVNVASGESVERVQDSETAIAEFPTVRRIWERIIGKLKASERRMLEEKMADTPMPDDEWEERILAYKSSTWGTSNNYPLRGFLKDPQSWEVRNQPESTALVVSSSSAVRDAVAARPAVQALFYQFIKNGRELTEPEMADGIAAIAEFQLSDDNLNCSTGHAERNFPKWTHIPGPGNYLRKHKPWTTLKIDNPVPRQPVKMSIQDQVMERRYQKHPEERPRV